MEYFDEISLRKNKFLIEIYVIAHSRAFNVNEALINLDLCSSNQVNSCKREKHAKYKTWITIIIILGLSGTKVKSND